MFQILCSGQKLALRAFRGIQLRRARGAAGGLPRCHGRGHRREQARHRGHGERLRLQLLFKLGGTESS